MLTEGDELAGVFEQLGEKPLAFHQGKLAKIVAVQVEQVEGEVSERLFDTLLEGGLQIREVGGAVGGEDDEFAVEDCGLGREGLDLGGDGLHAVGPVKTSA